MTIRHGCHWEGDCPPCYQLVQKMCSGGHMLLNAVPCHKQNAECGRKCLKNMECGLHQCSRLCHPAKCEVPLSSQVC
jgi:transcriptional repressor NF-X1